MDIGKFIDEFVATKDAGARDRLVKKHVVNTYLDFVTKVNESKKIIDHSCYDADGKFVVNSPLRFMLFTISVVKNYTDLEFDSENSLGQFDLLMKHGVVETIIPFIADDYASFETVLKMTFDDEYENQRSFVSFMEHKLDVMAEALASMELSPQEEENESE